MNCAPSCGASPRRSPRKPPRKPPPIPTTPNPNPSQPMTESLSRIDPSNPCRKLRVLPALSTGFRLFAVDPAGHARNAERPAGAGSSEWLAYELCEAGPKPDAGTLFHPLTAPRATHEALSLFVLDGTVQSHSWHGRCPWRDMPAQCFATSSAVVLDAIDEAEAREALAAHLAAAKPSKPTTTTRAKP